MTIVVVSTLSVLIIVLAFSNLKKALLLFTIAIPFTGYLPGLELKGINLQTLLIGVLFCAAYRITGRFFPPSPINVALAFLAAVTLLSWAVTAIFPPKPNPFMGAQWQALVELSNIKRWMVFIPLFFIYVNATRGANARELRYFLIAIALGVGLESLHVFKEYLVTGRVRVYGTLGNPNELGAFFSAYLPLIGIFFFQAHRMVQRLFYAGIGFLSLFALVYSQSRGAYLSFVNSLAIFSFIKSRILFITLVIALILTVTVSYTWLPDVVVNRIDFTFDPKHFREGFEGVAGQIEGSAASRLILAQGALRMFSESPIWGHGIGTLQYSIGFYMADLGYAISKPAHNMYLQILAELGLLGFLPFIYILYATGRAGYRLYRTGRDPDDRNLGIAFLCCFCAFAVSNLFGNRFFSITLTGYYWVLAAMVFNRLRERQSRHELGQSQPLERPLQRREAAPVG